MNYYITTNEIPGEFLRENLILIFSLVKMMSERNILVSHWCLYKKQNNTWPLGDTKFLFELSRIFHSST